MTFQAGDKVIWLKRTAGEFVFPVKAVVVAVTPKRIKIKADDPEEGEVVRHVSPASLQYQQKTGGAPKRSAAVKRGIARMKSRPQKDAERERRITYEIIVDCYDEYERAMGWCCYLENRLHFPFTAECTSKRIVSPLRLHQQVEVIGMAPEEECERDMYVLIRWDNGDLAVPLSQLTPMNADKKTREAIEDWHYWIKKGYRF